MSTENWETLLWARTKSCLIERHNKGLLDDKLFKELMDVTDFMGNPKYEAARQHFADLMLED